MLMVFLWWLSGLLGIGVMIVLWEDVKIPEEVKVGDVVSLFLESWFGPVVWCFILLGLLCAEERPKWESKVIYKGNQK